MLNLVNLNFNYNHTQKIKEEKFINSTVLCINIVINNCLIIFKIFSFFTRKNYCICEIFDFQFSTDLEGSVHDLTVFRKYLCVSLSVCV